MFLRDKLIMQGEKRETSAQTCNETMLRAKLRVFVSRISPPYNIANLYFEMTFSLPSPSSLIFSCDLCRNFVETKVERSFRKKFLVGKHFLQPISFSMVTREKEIPRTNCGCFARKPICPK